MNLITLWFIQSDGRGDDRVEINRGSRAAEMVTLKYTPGDSKTGSVYSFSLTRSGVRRYLENLLYSLSKDQDPFEKIQIASSLGPAIMYHVADLDDVQSTIISTIDDALYVDVTREA
jgi:hypothetical protein